MTQEFTKLTARLEKLEQQNRTFKRAGLGLVGALAVVGMIAAKPVLCDTVSAERFVLHDARGKTRMLMDAYHTEPNIQLRNTSGKTVATLGVDKKGEAYLTFFDASGKAKGSKESCEPAKCESKKKDDGTIAMR